MPRVKVSVVVPVYNTGKYVDECAPSLLGQSLPADEYEVIYVDDGSTDDTLTRLEKIAAGHLNVQVHTRPNSGWPGAAQSRHRHAKGEYIQFVDHDDMLGPEALERLYEHAKRNDADVVLGKMSSTMVVPDGCSGTRWTPAPSRTTSSCRACRRTRCSGAPSSRSTVSSSPRAPGSWRTWLSSAPPI